ncbi:hypothetical protein [Azomonas macrocytogenes]|uniref:Uncharacterized protein n=1 Tax=Azomonas macrocytogenes TaxID=69962 RepID=A0A839T803_AZOMA|nr:hypothetical protein [Azomonas macrocytogenes]MBB3104085.1 hypothetical protein [Azomonas macrocytogenes]
MKTVALIAVAALLIGSQAAQAKSKNLCEINLQEIDQNLTMAKATLGEPLKTKIEEQHQQALSAQKAGDIKGCIASSTKALHLLKGPGGSGAGGSSGSGSGN